MKRKLKPDTMETVYPVMGIYRESGKAKHSPKKAKGHKKSGAARTEPLRDPAANLSTASPAPSTRPFPGRTMGPVLVCILAPLVVAGMTLLVLWLTGDFLVFDLTRESSIGQWSFSGQGTRQRFSPGLGLEFSSREPYMVYGPKFNTFNAIDSPMNWESYPYVKLTVNKSPIERKLIFLGFLDQDQSRYNALRLTIPRDTETLIINTRQTIPWRLRFPLTGEIYQFGFQFFENISIRSVSLQSSLSPVDYLILIARDFNTTETFLPSSINFLYGPQILGLSLSLYIGVSLLVTGIVFLVRAPGITPWILTAACLIGTAICDVQFDNTLVRHAKDSCQVSAWHAPPHEENASRFGSTFADLAEAVEKSVPKNSVLFCTWDSHISCPREVNWMYWFFSPRYRFVGETRKNHTREMAQADFIVYYYPIHYDYDAAAGRVFKTGEPQVGIRVALVTAISSNAQLFRVIHD
ncbi:MAG: hypothetical protein V1793_09680 [Pseudomonadota bacterium]